MRGFAPRSSQGTRRKIERMVGEYTHPTLCYAVGHQVRHIWR
jgi:hypothetical protein